MFLVCESGDLMHRLREVVGAVHGADFCWS